MVDEILGNVREVFAQLDSDKSNDLDASEVKTMIQNLSKVSYSRPYLLGT